MSIPFAVRRTQSNHLPVWRETRQNGFFISTFVGKIRGDILPLKNDIEKLLDYRARVEIIKSDASKFPRLKIRGDHYVIIREYLDSIGF